MCQSIEQLSEISLAEKLGRSHRLWRTAVDHELSPLGLTYPRWSALWKLFRLGDKVSQKVLANALEIELPSLMRTLGQLEQQGLIERHCCSEDKRARIVCMTAEGKTLLKQVERRVIDIRKELLAGINHAELNQLERIVTLISNNATDKLAQQKILNINEK
ncbi:MarR family transcriptional regulator [Vibrio sp. 10N.286.49.B3]|uniref:transcriptional regulator SlyA n=1 Tax=Vibrio sp. 10N.286.49.B3 TaxID=1880855 RepID=UPI000C829541|nr:transcriptional regulator SlyA [Vibrio sp. 10N.286.49.B3]PMH44816.1 MarR family transcriptional regulator [Vibrio sp. 10N.286.49.B3]